MNTQSNIQISIGAHRFLADHRFQATTVAPGTLHTVLAIAETVNIEGKVPALLKKVSFDRAIIVTEHESLPFTLTLSSLPGSGRLAFTLCEYDTLEASVSGQIQMLADPHNESVDVIGYIRKRVGKEIDRKAVYEHFKLRQNQYGQAFQGILSVQFGQDEALALLADPDPQRSELWQIDPCLLDCCIQTLAIADKDEKRTFTLVGFKEFRINATDLNGACVHSRITERKSDSLLGDIDVFTRDGNIALQFTGVELKYLDTIARQPIYVAANFTAEPIADSLDFWAGKFSLPVDVEFAAYNQIFQELLNPSGLFGSNISGTNIILLRLEEWLGEKSPLSLHCTPEERDILLGDAERYTLAPAIEIGQINEYESRYLHKEIFVDRAYCRHDVSFRNARCILDVGANIGLFSLFCESESPGVKILSFEPSPRVFELLSANTRLYAPGAKAFNIGLSDSNRDAEFTFYRNSSVFSTFHADEKKDHDAIEAVVKNVLHDELGEKVDTDFYASALTEGRTSSETLICPLRTISQIIRDEKLDQIDILKVDAEKSELDVLRGIEDEHWQLIRQVVVEVHESGHGEIDEARSLLQAQGFDVVVEQEKLLEHSGLYGVFARRPEYYSVESEQTDSAAECKLFKLVEEFVDALQVASDRGGAPHLICLAPSSPESAQKRGFAEAIARAEKQLTNAVALISGAHLLPCTDLPLRYRLQTFFDSHSNVMGNVPYTSESYSALGTEVFRGILSYATPPRKVLVLDCDNTLWRGVCGEDGVNELQIEAGHLALQHLALASREHGTLICLVSKNEETDVMRVFDLRMEMPLRRKHLTAWKINWDSKSENIRRLAIDLSVGLDSFIFLDDNPLECTEVRAACPEVSTIQVPTESEELTHFAGHLWALDRLQVTNEDRKRAEFYAQENERKKLRIDAVSMVDFISKLNLQVDIFEAKPEDYERTSQLTLRTNQFNFTTLRCSVEEVRENAKSECGGWLLVRVTDRFGDYGTVGAARYSTASKLCVDAFMISCRVLGRGVEHRMVAALGQIARSRGCTDLTFIFRRSTKNDPALNFLMSAFKDIAEAALAGIAEGTERKLVVSVDAAVDLRFDPAAQNAVTATAAQPAEKAAHVPAYKSVLESIPETLSSGRQIYAAVMAAMMKPRPPLASVFAEPQSDLEKLCCDTWARVFKLDRVGIDDDFFALGGTSLLAVQVASELSDRLGKRISTIAMFEGSTVRTVAASLSGEFSAGQASKLNASLDRGRQRRKRSRRRGRSV